MCTWFLIMASRASWKGELKIGSSKIPVKLYAAVQDRDVHFHILQKKTGNRVKQQMVTEDEEGVEREEIRKGYEIEPGTFVILKEPELKRLQAKPSRTIGISRFVPVSTLGHEWYERGYYLGPDGSEAEYFALTEALRERNKLGVAHWSMRGRSYVGALRAESGYLVLIRLRYAGEVLPARELPSPAGRPPDPKELRMAEELVGALAGEFKPDEFRDEYRDRLQKFIEAKAKGRFPRLALVKDRPTGGALDEQLSRSLAALKRAQKLS